MNWLPFSFTFKQVLVGAYRYLDRSGEFMLQAEKELELAPTDVKVTGIKMGMPEHGIDLGISTREFVVTQESPDDQGARFFRLCIALNGLVQKHFGPVAIHSNGCLSRSYLAMGTPEMALARSLEFGGTFHSEIAKHVGMAAAHKQLNVTLTSGKTDLHITLRPVNFEKQTLQKHSVGFRASEAQKKLVERLNKQSKRAVTDASYAIMLDTDLIEYDPPVDALEKHFDILQRQDSLLREFFLSKTSG